MHGYFNILRPINLLIIALIQYSLYFLILIPGLIVEPALNIFEFSLLVLCTVLLAAGAYIINDITDVLADMVNKPDYTYINNSLSFSKAWFLYIVCIILGLISAILLAISAGESSLLWIFPVVAALLFLYSRYLKGIPLIGNLTVASLAAFVPMIIVIAERNLLFLPEFNNPNILFPLADHHNELWHLLLWFSAFCFIVTLNREIVKDLEDMEGDEKSGILTLPLWIGKSHSRYICIAITLLTILGIGIWLFFDTHLISRTLQLLLLSIFIIPFLIVLYYQNTMDSKSDYSKVSKLLKIVMVLGILIVLLFRPM